MLSSSQEFEDTIENEEWARINEPEVRKRVQNRLSQRKHRACSKYPFALAVLNKADRPSGDKLRQQRELENREIIIPPSFGASCNVDAGPSTSDFATPLRSFNSQDDRSNLGRSIQSHNAYEDFDSVGPQDILPPEHDVSGSVGHPLQFGPPGLPRSTASPMGPSHLSGASQATAGALGPLASPPTSITADSRNEYWMNMSPSDRQWPVSGYQSPTVPLPSMAGGVNNLQLSPSHPPRHVLRPFPRRTGSASSHSRMAVPSSSNISETYQSVSSQKHLANQAYLKTISQASNAPRELESRSNHSTCSHCGSSRAAGGLDGHESRYASPKTCRSTPSRDSDQTSSTNELDILSNCGNILAGLARESESNTEHERGRRGRHHRRKRSSSSMDHSSPRSDRNSQDGGRRECARHNVVEKVVILCLKGGRVERY